jgi:hypothetical protein
MNLKPSFLTNRWIELNEQQTKAMIDYCSKDLSERRRLLDQGLRLPSQDFAFAMVYDNIEDRMIVIAIGIHIDTHRLANDIDRAVSRDTKESLIEFMNRVTIGVGDGPSNLPN